MTAVPPLDAERLRAALADLDHQWAQAPLDGHALTALLHAWAREGVLGPLDAAPPAEAGRETYEAMPKGAQLVHRWWVPGERMAAHDHGSAIGAELVVQGGLALEAYREDPQAPDHLQLRMRWEVCPGAAVPLWPLPCIHAVHASPFRWTESWHLYGPGQSAIRNWPHVLPEPWRLQHDPLVEQKPSAASGAA